MEEGDRFLRPQPLTLRRRNREIALLYAPPAGGQVLTNRKFQNRSELGQPRGSNPRRREVITVSWYGQTGLRIADNVEPPPPLWMNTDQATHFPWWAINNTPGYLTPTKDYIVMLQIVWWWNGEGGSHGWSLPARIISNQETVRRTTRRRHERLHWRDYAAWAKQQIEARELWIQERYGEDVENGEGNQTFSHFVQVKAIFMEVGGGQCSTKGTNDEKKLINGIAVVGYRNKNNECLVTTLCHIAMKSNRKLSSSIASRQWIRTVLGLEPPALKAPIRPMDVNLFARYFQLRVRVIDEYGMSLSEPFEYESTEEAAHDIVHHIMLYEDHYWHVINMDHKVRKCPKCRMKTKDNVPHHCKAKLCEECHTWYIKTHTQCNQGHIRWMVDHQQPTAIKQKEVKGKGIFKDKLKPFQTIYFDMETFTSGEHGQLQAYAVGWRLASEPTGMTHYSWGKNCISEFLDWIEKEWQDRSLFEQVIIGNKKKFRFVLIGFNNSGFDSHFLLSEMLARGMKDVKFMLKSRLILRLKCTYFTSWDLIRFLPGSSLAKAARDFEAPPELRKSFFPHKFIDSWDHLDYVGAAPGRSMYFEQPPADWDFPTEGWNFKEECLKYLALDVLATEHVHRSISSLFEEKYGVDMTQFVTLSQMSYELWAQTVKVPRNLEYMVPEVLRRPEGDSLDIFVPTVEQYQFIRPSVLGGMVYPTKQYFESSQFGDVLSGEVGYDGVTHYILPYDVVSLYPAAMHGYDYPVGTASWVEPNTPEMANLQELLGTRDYLRVPLGILEIHHRPNPTLILPTFAHREKPWKYEENGECRSAGSLRWDNREPEESIFCTTIDAVRMLLHGDSIEVKRALLWSGRARVFEQFISSAYAIKANGDREKKESLRVCGKILMNALYGKMLQLPVTTTTVLVNDSFNIEEWLEDYEWTDVTFLNNIYQDMILEGTARDIAPHLTKPCHLGAFVLSYSRVIMDKYRTLVDPYMLTEPRSQWWWHSLQCSQHYGDTDSLHVEVGGLYNQDLIDRLKPHIKQNELGMLWEDMKNGEKVIQAIYLCPKTYALRTIDRNNKLGIVMKCKGVRAQQVHWEDYQWVLGKLLSGECPFEIDEETGVCENPTTRYMEVLKRTGSKTFRSSDGLGEYDAFSIIRMSIRRTLWAKEWTGRMFYRDERVTAGAKSSLGEHRVVKCTWSVPLGFPLELLAQLNG